MTAERAAPSGLAAEFDRLCAELDRLAAAEVAATPDQRRAAQRSYRAARRAQARYVDPWLLDALGEALRAIG